MLTLACPPTPEVKGLLLISMEKIYLPVCSTRYICQTVSCTRKVVSLAVPMIPRCSENTFLGMHQYTVSRRGTNPVPQFPKSDALTFELIGGENNMLSTCKRFYLVTWTEKSMININSKLMKPRWLCLLNISSVFVFCIAHKFAQFFLVLKKLCVKGNPIQPSKSH